MFGLMIQVSQWALPVFIFLTMAHVGITQDVCRILTYWTNWPFQLKMLVANFMASPLAMWALLQIWPQPLAFAVALAVYSLCAGAPFLIKLTAVTEQDLALGAATMMLLVLATIVLVPLLMPLVMPSATVDAAAMAANLARQLVVPIIVGATLASLFPKLAHHLAPWVAKGGSFALFVVIVATVVGYWPEIGPIFRSGALLLGLLYIVAASAIGYLAGWGADHLEDIGALATAQRNTAAAMLIAVTSFDARSVFVLIALLSAIGVVFLLGLAKFLARDNEQRQVGA